MSIFREVSELVVSIIQARDLTANQYTGSLDTYIRGILLPDTESRFQTKVIVFCDIQHKIPSPFLANMTPTVNGFLYV